MVDRDVAVADFQERVTEWAEAVDRDGFARLAPVGRLGWGCVR